MSIKNLFINALMAITIMVSQSASADDRTKEEISAAKAFKIEGAYPGMPKAEFLRQFPKAAKLPDLTDATTNTTGYRVDSTAKTDGIDAAFWNDKLIDMYVWYSAERINEMGGTMTLVNRLVKLFGKGDADSKGQVGEEAQIKWKIDEAHFYCEILIKPKITRINLADTMAFSEQNAKKAEAADPGF